MSDRFEQRIRACQDRLEVADADCVVLFPSPDLTYATGFDESPSERHLLLFVPQVGDPTFVAPELYGGQLRETWIDDRRLWADDDDPLALIEEVLTAQDVGGTNSDERADVRGQRQTQTEAQTRTQLHGESQAHILVDDTMWATFTQDLRSVRPNATFGLASAVFEPLRLRKDEVELEALERAANLADRVALEIRERGRDVVGMTEAELASEIDRLLGLYGEGETDGGDPAFTTIVASGPNGARPHHHSGDREISPGDPVVLDFGAFVAADLESGTGRYPGDQTRTIVFDGGPEEEFRHVHDVVREAQQAAVEAVEPGVTASAVDRAARTVIEDAGYGDAFTHRTGHGVGLEVHEPPYIVAGNDRDLEPGMVFSIEPGVYLEGEFGVRIEDLVVVTDDGAERLNETRRGW